MKVWSFGEIGIVFRRFYSFRRLFIVCLGYLEIGYLE